MKQFFLNILSLLILAACSPVMYTPTAYQVPMFEQKGEAAITVGYHGIDDGDGDGFNLQVAATVDNNIAITATLNYFQDVYRKDQSQNYWKSSGSYIEAGLGKYGFIADSPRIKYEIYGGVGYGRSNNQHNHDRIYAAYYKPYIQPNIGISGKHIEFAVTTRFAIVSFKDPDYFTADAEYRDRVRTFFDEKSSSVVFEPGFTLRGGLPNLKAQLQYVYSTFNYQEGDGANFGYSNNYASLGLFWLISNRYK
jgi:hypothetical protein